MPTTTINRSGVGSNDDGSLTTGTIVNAAYIGSAIYDKIDAMLADDLVLAETLTVPGTVQGVMAIGGSLYNHVMLCIGLNGNPLNQTHQVAGYTNISANSYATGAGSFLGGFETALSIDAGSIALERSAAFVIGAHTVGAGSSVTRTYGFACAEETVGTHNAALAVFDAAFTGNWFIYYSGSRPSRLGGGDLIVGTDQYRTSATSYLRLAGGSAAGTGATVLMFGESHASSASKIAITSTTLGVDTSGNLGIPSGGKLLLDAADLSGNSYLSHTGADIIGIFTNGTRRINVGASGGIGIGATTDNGAGTLVVAGVATFNDYISAQASAGGGVIVKGAGWDAIGLASSALKVGGFTSSQWTSLGLYASGSLRWNIDTAGALVGASNVNLELHGTGQFYVQTTSAATGTAVVHNANGFYYDLSSSRRFKENFEAFELTDEQILEFLALKSEWWDYLGGGEDGAISLMAEALAGVKSIRNRYGRSPFANYDAKGRPESNRDYALIAALHQIVGKLYARVQALETR